MLNHCQLAQPRWSENECENDIYQPHNIQALLPIPSFCYSEVKSKHQILIGKFLKRCQKTCSNFRRWENVQTYFIFMKNASFRDAAGAKQID